MDERDVDRDDEGASEQADEMDDRARRMEKRSEEVERDIDTARSDWESKQGDESVPGAQTEGGATGRPEDDDD